MSALGRHTALAPASGSRDDPWRASSPPIYQTATFEQESAAGFGAFDYARSGNPTRETLEKHCARLEGAHGAFAFASGVAAVTAVARLVRTGERIVAHTGLYGGTQRLLSRLAEERGVEVAFAGTNIVGRIIQCAQREATRGVDVANHRKACHRQPIGLMLFKCAAHRDGHFARFEYIAVTDIS